MAERHPNIFLIMADQKNIHHGVPEAKGLFDADSMRRVRRAYYALITYVDEKVRELLSMLQDTNLLANTVVIFCSDHGEMLFEKGMVMKRSFYEWSSHVPLIVRLPDGWKRAFPG